MKRIAMMAGALLGLALSSGTASASWGHLHYSGYQPWWNICAKRYKCLTPEEERLQKFWHDYYDALRKFYKSLDKIDWVAYYKNHGYQINAGGPGCAPGATGCGRINYAPVFVSPTLQWAVPAGAAPQGPPYANGGAGCAPGMPPGAHGPMGYPGASVPVNTPLPGGGMNGLPIGAVPTGPNGAPISLPQGAIPGAPISGPITSGPITGAPVGAPITGPAITN
jgi:hypothetical protein